MDIEFLKTSVVQFVQAHQAYAPLVLGLMTFAESLAFVSLLLPTTAVLITVGFVLAAADVPFWQIWAGAACGAFLGNWVSYAIGRIRAVIALIAGIFLMPPMLFQAANMASASAWAFLVLGPGASLVHHLPW